MRNHDETNKAEPLSGLQGEKGAKSVMLAHKDELVSVPFPEGAVDLDTGEDLEKWGGG